MTTKIVNENSNLTMAAWLYPWEVKEMKKLSDYFKDQPVRTPSCSWGSLQTNK